MGGLLILFAVLVPTLLWARLDNVYVWVASGSMFAFGAIGFVDDYLKVVRRQNKGLSARAQVRCSRSWSRWRGGVGAATSFRSSPRSPSRSSRTWCSTSGRSTSPFVVFVLVGASNAVNLTDGLDGLAIGATLIAAATYAIFTYVAGHRVVAEYLQVAYVPGVGEVAVFCGALVGASPRLPVVERHPAEVFMGDVGSLALGGAIGTVARARQAGGDPGAGRRAVRARGAVGDRAGGVASSCAASACSAWRRCTTTSSSPAGRSRRSSCASGSSPSCSRCSRSRPEAAMRVPWSDHRLASACWSTGWGCRAWRRRVCCARAASPWSRSTRRHGRGAGRPRAAIR